jgi:hypothetical protein
VYIKAKGKFLVEPNSIRVVLGYDFCKFYKWLFDRAHWFTIKTQLPLHEAHIGVVNPKLHKDVDTTSYKYLNNQEIWIEYSPDGFYGGATKGFKNFWFDVKSEELYVIATKLNVLNSYKNISNFHITILNNKNLK